MRTRELIIPLLLLAIVFLYILTGAYLNKWEVLPMVSCKKGYPEIEFKRQVISADGQITFNAGDADANAIYMGDWDNPGEYVLIDSLGVVYHIKDGKPREIMRHE